MNATVVVVSMGLDQEISALVRDVEEDYYWVVEVNLAPIWRGQSDNLAESPIWFNLAAHKNIQSGQSGKNEK